MKYQDGNEYTIGKVTDNTVKVIRWKGEAQVWAETVTWAVPDTTGDAIRRALEQRESDDSRSEE